MNELELKYGCNPNQKPARIFMPDGGDLPVRVLNGRPGFINFLDALNSWQLVKELKEATGLPAAASFKHVSPAGAAVGKPLSETDRAMYFVEDGEELSPIASAYIRARGADRLCSYGDWAALSEECDAATARYLKAEVYRPVADRAWQALTTVVHPDGFLGWMQGTGKQPSDGQPLSYDRIPDFEDYGTGCFLLGATEYYKLISQ